MQIAVGVELLESTRQRASEVSRGLVVFFAIGTAWIHGFLALILPGASAGYGELYEASIIRAVTSLPSRPLGGRIIALNFPDYLRSAMIDVYRTELVPFGPRRLDFILISPGAIAFERTSTEELELDAGNDALTDPSTARALEKSGLGIARSALGSVERRATTLRAFRPPTRGSFGIAGAIAMEPQSDNQQEGKDGMRKRTCREHGATERDQVGAIIDRHQNKKMSDRATAPDPVALEQ